MSKKQEKEFVTNYYFLKDFWGHHQKSANTQRWNGSCSNSLEVCSDATCPPRNTSIILPHLKKVKEKNEWGVSWNTSIIPHLKKCEKEGDSSLWFLLRRSPQIFTCILHTNTQPGGIFYSFTFSTSTYFKHNTLLFLHFRVYFNKRWCCHPFSLREFLTSCSQLNKSGFLNKPWQPCALLP